MRFINKFVYSIAALILVVAVIGLFLPSRANVERDTRIGASPATVFALLNDFHQVNKWSHWLEEDPNARFDFFGPRRGVGATFAWDGNIIGKGRQTSSESVPFKRIIYDLNFEDEDTATTIFDLSEVDEETVLVWTFNMEFGFNLVDRYIGLIIGGVIGENNEEGLASLKLMAEGLPKADFSDMEIEHIVVEATDIAFQATSSIP